MRPIFSVSAALLLAGTMLSSAALAQTYQSGAPGYPQGQPLPPASKPYYSPSPAAGSGMAPQPYGGTYATPGAPYEPGSPYIAPYSTYPGNSAFDSPAGYPAGQPVQPANKFYHTPLAGSGAAPQYYGSAFGTPGAPYGAVPGQPYYPNQGRVVPGENGNQAIGSPQTPSNPN